MVRKRLIVVFLSPFLTSHCSHSFSFFVIVAAIAIIVIATIILCHLHCFHCHCCLLSPSSLSPSIISLSITVIFCHHPLLSLSFAVIVLKHIVPYITDSCQHQPPEPERDSLWFQALHVHKGAHWVKVG